MKFVLLGLLALSCTLVYGDTPEISVPERDIDLIKSTDYIEITGTNDHGEAEDFTIHNDKAIRQFVQFLTSERYIAVPKSLKPNFKSLANYDVRLFSKDAPVLELHVIADSVLDIPDDASYYMQSDEHSDNLMAPLLRLR